MHWKNIRLLYESREGVIKLFNDYSSILSEAKYKTIHGKGILSMSARGKMCGHSNLKILSPKQILQRLPIALGQVKARSTSENLLNKMRQVIYSLYRVKEITERVYNNIKN